MCSKVMLAGVWSFFNHHMWQNFFTQNFIISFWLQLTRLMYIIRTHARTNARRHAHTHTRRHAHTHARVITNFPACINPIPRRPSPGAGFTKPLRLTKAGLSDWRMHFSYALVRKSSFSKAQGFVKPDPGQERLRVAREQLAMPMKAALVYWLRRRVWKQAPRLNSGRHERGAAVMNGRPTSRLSPRQGQVKGHPATGTASAGTATATAVPVDVAAPASLAHVVFCSRSVRHNCTSTRNIKTNAYLCSD